MTSDYPTCSYINCTNTPENHETGLCATHGRLARKAETNALKEPKKLKPIKKVGTKQLFECSDGMKVTQQEIKTLLFYCYEKMLRADIGNRATLFHCEGCGNFSHPIYHAHIVPQARCKQLRKTELIWNSQNIFFSCNTCNSIAENVSSQSFTKLLNFERLKAYLELHDPERASKISYSQHEPHIL